MRLSIAPTPKKNLFCQRPCPHRLLPS